MSIGHAPRCSLCRIGQNLFPVYISWRFLATYIKLNFEALVSTLSCSLIWDPLLGWIVTSSKWRSSRFDMHIHILKYVSQKKFCLYNLVLVPLQSVNRNHFYTILYWPEVVHIWHNNWLLCVNSNICLRSDHRWYLWVLVQGNLYLKSICLMTRLSCFD